MMRKCEAVQEGCGCGVGCWRGEIKKCRWRRSARGTTNTRKSQRKAHHDAHLSCKRMVRRRRVLQPCALQQRSLTRKSSPSNLASAVIPTGSYSLGTPPTSSTCKRRAAPEEPRCTLSQHIKMVASVDGTTMSGGQGRAGFRRITQVNASTR